MTTSKKWDYKIILNDKNGKKIEEKTYITRSRYDDKLDLETCGNGYEVSSTGSIYDSKGRRITTLEPTKNSPYYNTVHSSKKTASSNKTKPVTKKIIHKISSTKRSVKSR